MSSKPGQLSISQPIMLVEDSDDDFEATKRALLKVNLRNPILRFESGQGALNYLSDTANIKPGLILLDLNMPGMDGRKTLKHIKENPAWLKIPVIILTTSNDNQDVKQCYELGANTYVQKPVDMVGLIAAVERMKEYWFEIALLPKDEAL